MAIAPVTVFDSFNRAVADSFGVTDSGHTWLGELSNYDTFKTGSYGRIFVAKDAPTNVIYIDVPNDSSQEVLYKVKWNVGSLTDHGPVLRRSSSNTYYYARIQANFDEIAINVSANGSVFELNRTSFALPADTWHWVRFRCDGSGLHLKMWEVGDAEPSSWTLETSYFGGSNPPASGDFGYYTKGTSAAYSVYIDTLYWYSLTDTTPNLPVTDTFTRENLNAWGWSDTNHIWEGSASDDPAYLSSINEGSVEATYAKIVTTNTVGSRSSFIGPSVKNSEVLADVYIASSGAPNINVGLRGDHRVDPLGGTTAPQIQGYMARLTLGSTTFQLLKVASFTSGTSVIGSFTLAAAPLTTERWFIKIQANGTAIKAKAWKSGGAEPAFQISVTDSSLTTGKSWTRVAGTASTTDEFRFYDFSHTVISDTNSLTTGTLSTSSVTDTSFSISAAFTNDSNANSTCTIQYKESTSDTWITATSSRGSGVFTASASSLKQGTQYDVQATFSDVDGIVGTNPRTTTVTTALNGVDTDRIILDAAASTIDVVATYLNDANDGSTASIEYRALGTISTLAFDTFSDIDGTDLEDHVADNSTTWTQHVEEPLNDLTIDADGRLYATVASARHLYLSSAVPSSADYDVEATVTIDSLEGEGGVCFRADPSADTYYFAVYSGNGNWYLTKRVAGVDTTLGSWAEVLAVTDSRTLTLLGRGTTIAVYVDGTPRISVTDSSISATGCGGVRFFDKGLIGKGIVLTDFTIRSYSSPNSYTSAGSMVADRPNKQFTKQLTSLSGDTTYEVKVTFSDTNGVRGINPLIGTATTLGKSIQLVDINAFPTSSSAVIVCDYLFDTNDNATCVIQYRDIREVLWTTIVDSEISYLRVAKQFRTTIGNLIPNASYEVQLFVDDPDGVALGTESTVSTIFTTLGQVVDPDLRGKHYVFKVYNADDEYLGTWADAPTPKFTFDENGGVTDLKVVLPRSLSSLNSDQTIGFRHRVDVWAIDGSSSGMGINLVNDSEMELGSWTLTTDWSVLAGAGPDDSTALRFDSSSTTQRIVLSEVIPIQYIVPLSLEVIARAVGGKLRFDIVAYDEEDNTLDTSIETAETVGSDWQRLQLDWIPPNDTAYVRVRAHNIGKGKMTFDKVSLKQKEVLIYRGRIESYESIIEQDGESVELEILGLNSFLTDSYVPFLQYVNTQPTNDINANRPHYPPDDPSNMMKAIIDIARHDNPKCELYYTSDSIKLTNTIVQYTFRDQRLDSCFDDVRTLCPPSWHWYVDPDGLVHLRGPQHVVTHDLRLGVEIFEFKNEQSIRNLKNYIIVRGRQDDDESEPDGFGSIDYVAFDQESIDTYGLRQFFIRDANIKDPDTAQIVGDGRLEELNKVEENGEAYVPDEKEIRFTGGTLRGYNIEAFRPGDFVRDYNPLTNGKTTYRDQFYWDDAAWDDTENRLLPRSVPIKQINYQGDHVTLSLSERQPSASGDFAKMQRVLRLRSEQTIGG